MLKSNHNSYIAATHILKLIYHTYISHPLPSMTMVTVNPSVTDDHMWRQFKELQFVLQYLRCLICHFYTRIEE